MIFMIPYLRDFFALGITFALLILFYRAKGFIATFTLIVWLWLLLIALNLLQATLSLAAIVAFVLGAGIAAGFQHNIFRAHKGRIQKSLIAGFGLQEQLRIFIAHDIRF
jgi:preprotein translocase subunit SecD